MVAIVVDELLTKYRLEDRVSKLECLNELNDISMKETNYPDEMFNKIATVRQKYLKSKVDEATYLNFAISVAPAYYTDVISYEVRTKNDSVTLEDLQSAMGKHYRLKRNKDQGTGNRANTSDEGSESVLLAAARKALDNKDEAALTAFMKELCYKCGQPGHKAFQCPTKGGNDRHKKRGNRTGQNSTALVTIVERANIRLMIVGN